ncbi:MAG TPA: FTR1 family protein [Verrucomicrobiae bacterium]|nr:FTR1 family protein [Verrucomicrobiae bacterium]
MNAGRPSDWGEPVVCAAAIPSRTTMFLATPVVRILLRIVLVIAALILAGVLVWQGITAHGTPDPTTPQTSAAAARLDIGVLVFREGLECILVLSAITASMVGRQKVFCRPVALGAAFGFVATIITWFVAVGIVSNLAENLPALHVQAATGLLAIIVLLVVMNWFFHKLYWGGWISLHTKRKTELLRDASNAQISQSRLTRGLCLLGFASLYREGFEVVLFLQSYRLKLGTPTVLEGALLGLFFTGIVAVLTFLAHHRLPYRKMLVLTGILLGVVLLVMVGEQVQEMQLAHWLPATPIPVLENFIPGWMGMWFAVFPTVETLLGQALAAALVLGCYFAPRFRPPRVESKAKLSFPNASPVSQPQSTK